MTGLQDIFLPIASIGISIIGLLWNHYREISGIKERVAKLESGSDDIKEVCKDIKFITDQVTINGNRITSLETKTDLFWRVIQDGVITMLKHPNCLDKDCLLDKLKDSTLTLDEAEKLKCLLKDDVTSKNTDAPSAVLALGLLEIELTVIKERIKNDSK